MKLRIPVLSLLVIISAGAAAWLYQQTDEAGRQMLAQHELESELISTSQHMQRIKIETHDGVLFSAVKDGERWIATHLDTMMTFPVDIRKLSRLANALSQIEVVEAKTSRPEHYHRLGVESVRDEDAQSVLIEIGGEREVMSLLVGHQAEGGRGSYVRPPEGKTSLLVNRHLPLPVTASEWLSRDVIPFNSSDIVSLVIDVANEPLLTLDRKGATADGWQISEADEFMTLRYPTVVGQAVDKLLRFDYEAVLPFTNERWQQENPIAQLIFSLSDGSEVMVYLTAADARGMAKMRIAAPAQAAWFTDWVFVLNENQARPFQLTLSSLIDTPR